MNTCNYAMSVAKGFAPKPPLRDCIIYVALLWEQADDTRV